MTLSNSKLFASLFLVCFVSNFAFSTQDEQWVLNKDHQADFEVAGPKVTFKYQPKGYSYFNAMYTGLSVVENQKQYWEFECSNTCTVGVAKRDAFADGYGIKGAFFNGNLMDGSSLLVHEFGVSTGAKDKIGLILDAAEKELKIYLIQNGRPLGLAYQQEAPYAKAIHPVVMFPAPGTVEIKQHPVTGIENLLTRQDFPNKDAEGTYKLVKAELNGEVKSLPEFAIFVARNKEHIDLNAQATNNLGGVIMKTGADAEGDLYKLDNVSSTLVGVFGKDSENENHFFGVLKTLNRVKFSENYEDLTIKNSVSTLQFKRFVPVKAPHKTELLTA